MMDDRAITEYKLIIKIYDQKKCAEYDPFGLCYAVWQRIYRLCWLGGLRFENSF